MARLRIIPSVRGRRALAIALALAMAAALNAAPTQVAGSQAAPAESASSHSNPIAPVLIGIVLMLAAAKLAGRAAERAGQPAVLGELVGGVVLGSVALVGWPGLEFLATNPTLWALGELGVILLLFEVGLESDLSEMRKVGASSLLVAILGVLAPLLLGWGVSAWMLPQEPRLVHVFIGATLCATSVGITARVLSDLGKLQTKEARIVLGAAVLDDVLGLVILAVVTGAIGAENQGAALDAWTIGAIVLKALGFLAGALLIGSWASRGLLRVAARLQTRGMLLVASIGFCLLLAWLADIVGLASIVGAFAAGLILDEVHFHDASQRTERPLADLLQPVATLLVPLFFVRMGVEVDLRAFARLEILGLAAFLTVAAALGKLACAGGALDRGVNRLAVAVGMLPRGEVGLIFAGIGAQLVLHDRRVVSPDVFSAVVVMVIVTTVIAPPLLKKALIRGLHRRPLAR